MESTITHSADMTRGIAILRAAVVLFAFLGDPLAARPAMAQTTCRVDLQITSPLTYVNTPFDPEIDFAALIEQAGIEGVVDYDSIRVIDAATGAVVAHALGIGFQDRDRGRVEWVIADPHQTAFEIRFQVVAERPPRSPAAYIPQIGTGDLLRYNAAAPRPLALIYPGRLVDLNGDGRSDLAGCWNYAYRPGLPWGGVVYYPRVGDAENFEFGERTQIRFLAEDGTTPLDLSSYVYLNADFADFDRDGLVDVVISPRHEPKLHFFQNTGNRDAAGTAVFRRAAILDRGPVEGSTDAWWPCRAVDLDGDEVLDLVLGSTFLRNRNPAGWPVEFDAAVTLDAGSNPTFLDVDGDARLDAVCLIEVPAEGAHARRVAWRRGLAADPPRFAPAQRLPDVDAAWCTDVAAANVVDVDGDRAGLFVQHELQQEISFYELQPADQGRPRFQPLGRARSVSAPLALGDQAWPCVTDWDADGDLDLLVGGGYGWPRIVRNDGSTAKPAYAAARRILADAKPIRLLRDEILGGSHWHNMGYSYPVFVDWDADGLADLLLPNETNRIFWYRNVGTAAQPKFGTRRQIICDNFPDTPADRRQSAQLPADESVPNSPYPLEARRPFFWRTGAAFADFTGDGMIDLVTLDGQHRQATLFRRYRDADGVLRLSKDGPLRLSDGRPITDAIVARHAHWTESFRAADWDGDGLLDLFYSLAGAFSGIQDGGSIYLLRNCGTPTHPVFESPVTMRCFGEPIRITSHGPHPWVGDYDGDGAVDIVACVEWSVYPFYRHAALAMPTRPTFKLAPLELGPMDVDPVELGPIEVGQVELGAAHTDESLDPR